MNETAQMDESANRELKELHKSLSENVDPKKFGFRNTYIYSHIILKVLFELFVDKHKIGIKPNRANLDDAEIEFLTKLIRKVDVEFQHRIYGEKHLYSVWELDVSNCSDAEIGEILKQIDDKLLQP